MRGQKPDFEGTLFKVGVPSTTAPSGARGHRILMLPSAVQMFLDRINSRAGVVVNGLPGLDDHPRKLSRRFNEFIPESEIGIANFAEIRDGFLYFSGNFQTHCWNLTINASIDSELPLGTSFEGDNSHVLNMLSGIWSIGSAELVGITVLLQKKASHRENSSFRYL